MLFILNILLIAALAPAISPVMCICVRVCVCVFCVRACVLCACGVYHLVRLCDVEEARSLLDYVWCLRGPVWCLHVSIPVM